MPEGTGTAVTVEGVNLYYGTNHVLKNVNLEVAPGEFFAFLGPSGCGKTTLLRLIAGFNHADTGRVLVGDRDVSDVPPWKRNVGMVFQSYALWPHMTVSGNVAFGLEERRLPRAEIARKVQAALDLVDLSHLADRRPAQLSGGQQQRVALARTIAVEPQVLLLDEPLSNLDTKLRVQVRRELKDLQRRLGLTTIFVTHDQEEANSISDRIAVMNDGVVQQVGTPVDLYERPANLFVAGFLGQANILTGERREEAGGIVFRVDPGLAFPMPAGRSSPRLVIRPEAIRLAAAGTAAGGVRAAITDREFLGATVRYGLRTDGGTDLLADVPFEPGRAPYDRGDQVMVVVAPGSLLWLDG
jgi:iron(III) transport system ATP-binding protein